MEELLAVLAWGLLRLLGQLLLWLLKRAVQLVLLVATGKWIKLGRAAQAGEKKPSTAEQIAQQLQKIRQRVPREVVSTARSRAVRVSGDDGPWPFEFAEERLDLEPESEQAALIAETELSARRARARARAKLRVPALPAQPRSLRVAVRDRKTVREALLLGAALSPRRPRY